MALARPRTARTCVHLQRDTGTGQDFLGARDEFMESGRAQTGVVA